MSRMWHKMLYYISALPVVVLLIINAAKGRLVSIPPEIGYLEDYPALWLTGVGIIINTIILRRFSVIIDAGNLHIFKKQWSKQAARLFILSASIAINHLWVMSQLNNEMITWFSKEGQIGYLFGHTIEHFNVSGLIFYITCIVFWYMMIWMTVLLITSTWLFIKRKRSTINVQTYLQYATAVVLSFIVYYVSLQVNDLFIEGLKTFEYHPNRAILLLISVILLVTLIILVYYSQKKFDQISRKKIYQSNLYVEIGAVIAPFLLITLVTVSLTSHIEYEVYSVYAFFLFILLLIVIGFIGLYEMTKVKRVSLTNRLSDAQDELLQYTHHVESLYRDVRTFKHDYHNVVIAINGFIDENDLDGLKAFMQENNYIQHVSEEYQLINKLILLDSPPLKSVFMNKISRCKNLGIEVNLDIHGLAIEMHEADLIRMVGVLLDNAIEATENLENKQIFIGVHHKEIVIGNFYSAKVTQHDLKTFGFTTKGQNRGIGLYSLKHVLKKYPNIKLKTEITKELFTQKITQL